MAVLIKLGIMGSLFLDVPFSSLHGFLPGSPVAPRAMPTAEVPALVVAVAEAPKASIGEARAAAAPSSATSAVTAPVTSESLLRRQEELNQREADLRQLERQIDMKLNELQSLETRIQSMLKEADATRDEKLKHLVDVYTNMKARQAAEVLETLDENIAVKILANMRGRQAGEMLTYVKPAKAARLSESLTRVQMPMDF